MSPRDAVKTCFRNYATFRGTASRSEYWWFFLFNLVVSFLLILLGVQGIRLLWSLVVAVPGLAVGVRRQHDAGRSGWWLLANLILPWGIYLLCTKSKTVDNPYADATTRSTGARVEDTPINARHCPVCGKLALPGQDYCTGCGSALSS